MTQEQTIFLQCPACHNFDRSIVVDSRRQHATNRIRRRRECTNCKSRYTTYEQIEYDSQKRVRARKKLVSLAKSLIQKLSDGEF